MKNEKIIKLNSILIIGFQSRNKKLKVDFSNRNSSIIYGKNGSGKTTFLRIINAILKQDSSILSSLNIKNIKISFTVNDIKKSVNIALLDSPKVEKIYISNKIPIHKISDNHNIQKDEKGYYIEESIDEKYNWTEFLESDLIETTSLSLGIERGITQDVSNINGEDIYHFFRNNRRYHREFRNINLHEISEDLSNFLKRTKHKNRSRRMRENSLSLQANHVFLKNIKMDNIEELLLEIYIKAKNTATERIQNALFDTLSFIFETTKNKDSKEKELVIDINFIESLLKTKSRIIEALDEDYNDNKFKSRMITILKRITTEEDIKSKVDNRILYDLIKNMMNELEIEKSLHNSINIFIERYNKFLGDGKKLVITENQIYIKIDKEQHPINILSSGERHIFTFLALIIIEGRNRNFIIIDEPEISLNIKWQRVLMTLLEELAPNTQIIVASHSPFLAKKMPDALVELLSEKI